METMNKNKIYPNIDINTKQSIGKLLLDYLKKYADKNNMNVNNISIEDLKNEIILFPSILNSELVDYVKNFENLPQKELDDLSDDTKMLLLKLGEIISAVDLQSSAYLYEKDVTKKQLENPDVVNDIKYNDKQYGIVHPVVKNIKNDASFLMELQEGVGLGKMTKIILWNSGLWLTIRPPQNEDLINLYTKLTQEVEYIAENTTMYGFSNISSVFYKVIWEYVLSHLIDTSLNINPKYLIKYISILDMDTILLGVLSQLFYSGFNTTLLCKNNYELDKDKNPKCNFSYNVSLDLPKLLWVDTSRVTTEMMSIISKRGPRSQSVNEIKEYQDKIKPTDTRTLIKLNNGKTLELDLGIPNLEDSFDTSEVFMVEIKKFINKSLASMKEDSEDKDIDNLKSIAVKTLFLAIYSHYVKSMKLGEFQTDKRPTILEALKTLSNNPSDINTIINKINNFITTTSISTIAIPEFICPVCGASQGEEVGAIFEHLVPVNMVNYFFTLSKLRFMKQLLDKVETK